MKRILAVLLLGMIATASYGQNNMFPPSQRAAGCGGNVFCESIRKQFKTDAPISQQDWDKARARTKLSPNQWADVCRVRETTQGWCDNVAAKLKGKMTNIVEWDAHRKANSSR